MPTARRTIPVLALCLAAAMAGCSTPSSAGSGDKSSMVLADGYEPDSLNPLLGYAEEGVAKFYDGLVSHDANRTVKPALAAETPRQAPDGLSWTVPLRAGVTFHDGSAFDAADVVATYRAAMDPGYAATITSSLSMLSGVTKVDDHTVRFDLKYPYAPFPHKLVLGILPSEVLATPAPLESSAVNTKPVGTGPYKLVEWRRGDRMVWQANDGYWGGAPEVKRVTVVFATDDNTRAQRMRAGEFDGTVLPPAQAKGFDGVDGYEVVHHDSADFRTVTLPSAHPVTGDPAVRKALNLAVNRRGMIDALLAGKGTPAHTPIPPALPEYAEPGAEFPFDQEAAKRLLDAAGWVSGDGGIRARDGVSARFSLLFPAQDSLRRDLAVAFASDARAVGLDVQVEGLGWDAIEPRMAGDAIVLGGGNPLDPDLQAYGKLHSSLAGDGFNNPGHYRNAHVDQALDTARRTVDPGQRAAAYRQMQRAYVDDPGQVYLVFLQHSYVMRAGWDGYQPVVEPHVHGTTWGPWWNIEAWKPRP